MATTNERALEILNHKINKYGDKIVKFTSHGVPSKKKERIQTKKTFLENSRDTIQ